MLTPLIAQKFASLYNCDESEIQVDGILNPDLYAAASPKVLWILKETWVHDSWRLLGAENAHETVGSSPTYQPMAYVMHSVFNGFPTWEEMDYIRDNPAIFSSLRHIAFINAKKILGNTRSDGGDIHHYYSLGKDLLVEQIAEIDPDIIIGCSPHFPELFSHLGASSAISKFESVDWAVAPNGKLIIHAYHPQQSTINRADYVNDLIQIIKQSRAQSGRREVLTPAPHTTGHTDLTSSMREGFAVDKAANPAEAL